MKHLVEGFHLDTVQAIKDYCTDQTRAFVELAGAATPATLEGLVTASAEPEGMISTLLGALAPIQKEED